MDILGLWQKVSKYPGGKKLFSMLLGQKIPYTGSLHATVLELEPGLAKVQLKDRHAVRNHLNSIHAAALMNLGELCSGLAFTAALPPGYQMIVGAFKVEYLKKARGLLTASSAFQKKLSASTEKKEYQVEALIHDEAGVLVCRTLSTVICGPRNSSSRKKKSEK